MPCDNRLHVINVIQDDAMTESRYCAISAAALAKTACSTQIPEEVGWAAGFLRRCIMQRTILKS